MNRTELVRQINEKGSFLCVGLDTDLNKMPKHLLKSDDPIFEFNKQIIDATIDYAVAYKPNTAFYEQYGTRGWESLQKTIEYIPDSVFTIADAKRGDIGNTSKMYAKAFFENMNFDSVTVAPYMGSDSVSPFLSYEGKWVILLALTSNNGAMDFQELSLEQGDLLFEKVLRKSQEWGTVDNMMYVVGATRGERFRKVRSVVPNNFLLVPGVGAQGGDLETVCKYGMNDECGLLVNSSRGIIYASDDTDFAHAAAKESKSLTTTMQKMLEKYM